jgi:histidine triad (HIT) family protein
MAQDCLFCRIARGEIPAHVVYQDDQVVAFRDITPQAPTHILIIPRQHMADLLQLTAEDGALLGKMTTIAAELARLEGLAERGFRLVMNTGPDAGQSVHHLHMHLLGGREMAWPPG